MTTQNQNTQREFPFAEQMEQKRKDYDRKVNSHIKKLFYGGMLGCALMATTPFYAPRIGVKNNVLFELGLTSLTCAYLASRKIAGDRISRERR